jgi:hypothetical protein
MLRLKNQTSRRDGIQDFLCPFTDMYITQGSNMGTHRGTMANDVRGAYSGVKYPYYAPCDCKLIWFDKSNGQGMWQSIEKVRFANGNIDYATFVTAHDETFDADKTMGSTIPQGAQLGNMGAKRNGDTEATGVHCHIEIAQHKYTISDWHKNKYGIYCFPDETDTDDCYFVDNTNIIYGMGGNWKYLSQIPVDDKGEVADQILHVGSKVRFDGVFKVDILKSPISTNLFGNTKLTGVSFNTYYNEKAKDYHWIPLNDWKEVDSGGSTNGQDDIITGGVSYVKNDNIYEVKEIDVPTNSARLTLNGHDVWVYSTYLYEV